MIQIGRFNELKVVKKVPFGLYLDGNDWGEILLPNKYIPLGTKLNDTLDVFLYFDSEDKIIATTSKPYAQLGDFSCLKVIDVNRVGAFLDWGLDKDLLVPRPEQQYPMVKDKCYIVYIKQDAQGRIVASSKLDCVTDTPLLSFKPGDEVSLLIAETTELGTKVIINNSHRGLIHRGDLFQTLEYGEKSHGYIKNIREDGKIDITLRKTGQDNITDLATQIIKKLQMEGGFLPFNDKSSSEDIQKVFNESKKSFKRAIGHLYKSGKISIEENGIQLGLK